MGMSDSGMVALAASLVCQGRLTKLEELHICGNQGVTDSGIVALARAVNVRGLPMLEQMNCSCYDKVTIRGISAIALAVINGCPHIRMIKVKNFEKKDWSDMVRKVVTGMLEAVGRKRKVWVA